MAELTPCPVCDGQHEGCEVCLGTNVLRFFRCPSKTLSVSEEQFVQAVVLVEQGVLPDEGGWLDQAATFVAGYPLVVGELNRWREHYEKVRNPPR